MDIGCNRLENAVKPQHDVYDTDAPDCCNRLENAVKPQPSLGFSVFPCRCNRLENAVKPQLPQSLRAWWKSCNRLENGVKPQLKQSSFQIAESCNRLENGVKPQQNGSKILLYSIFTSFMMLFVDFICQFQYIFLGHRAIRSATFLVLGGSDPTVASNFAFSAFSKFPASFEVKSL